jgi:TPP-dependent pyruvate/acetoin dehydrogenase alpha subunit
MDPGLDWKITDPIQQIKNYLIRRDPYSDPEAANVSVPFKS